ncbi:MarR family transcriptional regulator [Roseateles sp. DAIF2]|uniref:bifunctional helix-turn-helix transcriptional regulator/GNAT family N-acetyltransferase n=1 Tax=Roseateles sp. DAIF2 TaxID=2714952 RepID=UPI0018A2C712|nr:bifunctional helix-turn-helix transcriptional regulator/GNAT family N-acetyltransferase [Roseateles sp. DAIF2]QPF72999.1 MarR family transcriptional regulator [Roseateles sp. DAIF2]
MPDLDPIAAVRAFNRFYTRRIGALDEGLSHTEFSLAEARVLWELAHAAAPVGASQLSRELRLDLGYLSRLLKGLRERGLVRSRANPADARQSLLSLTAAGKRAFAPLDQGSQAQVGEMLARLDAPRREELLGALARVQHLLGDEVPAPAAAVRLRPLRSGDLGWVIARHGALYAQQFGFDLRFEALVARIAAGFVERFDPAREAGWIAEREADGERLGCVFLVQARDEQTGEPDPGWAQLRMLLLEPQARGLGLGKRLVAGCNAFARQAGCYRGIRLWTNSLLSAARGIYQAEGYRLIATEAHHSFGHDLVGETWELRFDDDTLPLRPPAAL